jgi:hypothetical protein
MRISSLTAVAQAGLFGVKKLAAKAFGVPCEGMNASAIAVIIILKSYRNLTSTSIAPFA